MSQFDLTYLSLGGGKQSSTIAEMIVEGELPRIDLAVFADTQDEPAWVYRQIEYLTKRLSLVDIPVKTVTIGNIYNDLMQATKRFAAIPVFSLQTNKDNSVGRLKRQCTPNYKISPIEKVIRGELLLRGLAKKTKAGAIRVNKGIQVRAIIGISLDEVERAKPNRTKWTTNTWPLLDNKMSVHKCVLWLQSHNLPVPQKSACLICPFHDNRYWRDLKDNHPDYWQHVVEFDNSMRGSNSKFRASAKGELFLIRQCVPLAEANLSTEQDHGQMEMFDVCDSGHCFM